MAAPDKRKPQAGTQGFPNSTPDTPNRTACTCYARGECAVCLGLIADQAADRIALAARPGQHAKAREIAGAVWQHVCGGAA